MVKLTIDETVMEVPTGTTILEAARSHGMNIPTLCYYKNLNDIGACRVCLVELKDKDKLVTACNTNVAEDMVVYTNTPAVREARQTNVELILSQHRVACTSCVRGVIAACRPYPINWGPKSRPIKKHGRTINGI